jgi:hypothetical protein
MALYCIVLVYLINNYEQFFNKLLGDLQHVIEGKKQIGNFKKLLGPKQKAKGSSLWEPPFLHFLAILFLANFF